jgi:hypothetical protein
MASRLDQARASLRKHGGRIGLELLVNAVLPFAIYSAADARLGDVGALIASSIPPILWSVVEFIRRRTVDALSLMVIAGIGLSLLAMFGGGGAKFLQLRENLVTGVIGLAFLVSALVGRPLVFYFARAAMMRGSADQAATFERVKDFARFRRSMTLMTLVWGVGLLASTAAACVLVFSVPIPTYLILSPILGYATMGGLGGWTFLYARRAQRRGEADRASREAAAAAAPGGGGLGAGPGPN